MFYLPEALCMEGACAAVHHGSESNSPNLLSPSTKWVLEMELGLSGLGVGDFTG